MVADKYNC